MTNLIKLQEIVTLRSQELLWSEQSANAEINYVNSNVAGQPTMLTDPQLRASSS